jgi:pSer/pThr/pTyr-binding forkhead associated (FHA) protein
MPVLILNLPNQPPRGHILADRALIGRRPFNTLMIPDPAVSRIHAWVGLRDAGYTLFDAGSRAGTLLRGQRVTAPTPLKHGDKIRVGNAILTFLESDQLPAGVKPIEPPPPTPVADPYDGGIYFDCSCGGPMWVGPEHAGAVGKCRYCGQRLVVPHRSGQTARQIAPEGAPTPPQAKIAPPEPRPKPAPAAPPAQTAPTAPTRPAPRRVPPPKATTQPAAVAAPAPAATATLPAPPELEICSICQTEIHPADPQTSCPSCSLTFHAQCWKENLGCSAYGCDQVAILAPKESPAAIAYEAASTPETLATDNWQLETGNSLPWDSVLLALSFVAFALGAIAYGLPSALTLLLAAVALLVGRARRKGFAFASILVSLVGIFAGYAMSMFWWRGQRVWERFIQ